MSLLPHLLSELESYRRHPLDLDLFDQNFGVGLTRDDLLSPLYCQRVTPVLSAQYLRPWRAKQQRHSGVSHVSSNKDGFKVNLDVQQFKPDEISVKVVDNCVVVEGKHEERQDEHGYIQRQFTRRYALPKGIDQDAITSNLTSDGVLMVSAPKRALQESSKERTIPITHTQAPAVQQGEKKEDKMEQ